MLVFVFGETKTAKGLCWVWARKKRLGVFFFVFLLGFEAFLFMGGAEDARLRRFAALSWYCLFVLNTREHPSVRAVGGVVVLPCSQSTSISCF